MQTCLACLSERAERAGCGRNTDAGVCGYKSQLTDPLWVHTRFNSRFLRSQNRKNVQNRKWRQ